MVIAWWATSLRDVLNVVRRFSECRVDGPTCCLHRLETGATQEDCVSVVFGLNECYSLPDGRGSDGRLARLPLED